MLMFCLAPLFFYLDGSIVKDISLKSESLSPAYIATSDRRCKTSAFLFHSCSYKYQFDNQDKKQSYFFLSIGAPETLILLRSDTSGGITSDVGQNYLINRIVTLLLFPLLALFVMLKGGRSEARQASPRIETPRNPIPEPRPLAPTTHRTVKPVFGKRR